MKKLNLFYILIFINFIFLQSSYGIIKTPKEKWHLGAIISVLINRLLDLPCKQELKFNQFRYSYYGDSVYGMMLYMAEITKYKDVKASKIYLPYKIDISVLGKLCKKSLNEQFPSLRETAKKMFKSELEKNLAKKQKPEMFFETEAREKKNILLMKDFFKKLADEHFKTSYPEDIWSEEYFFEIKQLSKEDIKKIEATERI